MKIFSRHIAGMVSLGVILYALIAKRRLPFAFLAPSWP